MAVLKKISFFVVMLLLFISCSSKKKESDKKTKKLFTLITSNKIPQFDESNAYDLVYKQVSLGPRNPNSKGHKAAKEFFKNYFSINSDTLIQQHFIYPGYNGEKLELTNFIARYNPSAQNRIILSAHWDTRPRAEKDKKYKNKPILGANDGASGVGILLELARVLKQNPVEYGVDIILFDGEDYGKEHDLDLYCLGSKFYSATIKKNKPKFGILLDLVGDIDAKFKIEESSNVYANEIVSLVWGIAKKINADKFITSHSASIYDDHIPLNNSGIKTVNIIDADLVGAETNVERRNYWHTLKDDMSNISKKTLKQVGDVLVNLIYSLKFQR